MNEGIFPAILKRGYSLFTSVGNINSYMITLEYAHSEPLRHVDLERKVEFGRQMKHFRKSKNLYRFP